MKKNMTKGLKILIVLLILIMLLLSLMRRKFYTQRNTLLSKEEAETISSLNIDDMKDVYSKKINKSVTKHFKNIKFDHIYLIEEKSLMEKETNNRKVNNINLKIFLSLKNGDYYDVLKELEENFVEVTNDLDSDYQIRKNGYIYRINSISVYFAKKDSDDYNNIQIIDIEHRGKNYELLEINEPEISKKPRDYVYNEIMRLQSDDYDNADNYSFYIKRIGKIDREYKIELFVECDDMDLTHQHNVIDKIEKNVMKPFIDNAFDNKDINKYFENTNLNKIVVILKVISFSPEPASIMEKYYN